jgi:hypothetical protein
MEFIPKATAEEIKANAHRIYEFLDEIGAESDSIEREEHFVYASDTLGLDYDVFYYAWLNKTAIE